MSFLSNVNDKTLHWVIRKDFPQATDIDEECNTSIIHGSDKEGGDGVDSCGRNVVRDGGRECKASENVCTYLKPGNHNLVEVKKSHKGKSNGILLTSYEQEVVEWALKGFLPMGSEGFLPTKTKLQLVRTHNSEKIEEVGRREQIKEVKVDLLEVQQKGNLII